MRLLIDTLANIGEQLNDSGILWGIGASILLNQYGLVDNPNDIDILVDIKAIDKVDKILTSLGQKKLAADATIYSTKYFYEYVVEGIDIDVMAGLTINFDNGKYEYIFDNQSITEIKDIKGIRIPFTSLEDWYILYQLIPNRQVKANAIETFLMAKGIKSRNLLNRALTKDLPILIRKRVQKLIDATK